MIITLSQWIESVERRISHLMKEVERMLPEIQALQESTKAFIAEVNTDISTVLGAVKSLQDQITVLQGKPAVSAEDLQSLSDLATQLTAATADVHGKTAGIQGLGEVFAVKAQVPADAVPQAEEPAAK